MTVIIDILDVPILIIIIIIIVIVLIFLLLFIEDTVDISPGEEGESQRRHLKKEKDIIGEERIDPMRERRDKRQLNVLRQTAIGGNKI
jgi:uncharacterized membrane protein YqiK